MSHLKRQFVHLPSQTHDDPLSGHFDAEKAEEDLELRCDYIENNLLKYFSKEVATMPEKNTHDSHLYHGVQLKKLQFIHLSVTNGPLTKVKHWILSLFPPNNKSFELY